MIPDLDEDLSTWPVSTERARQLPHLVSAEDPADRRAGRLDIELCHVAKLPCALGAPEPSRPPGTRHPALVPRTGLLTHVLGHDTPKPCVTRLAPEAGVPEEPRLRDAQRADLWEQSAATLPKPDSDAKYGMYACLGRMTESQGSRSGALRLNLGAPMSTQEWDDWRAAASRNAAEWDGWRAGEEADRASWSAWSGDPGSTAQRAEAAASYARSALAHTQDGEAYEDRTDGLGTTGDDLLEQED